jgi:hypothetical protein
LGFFPFDLFLLCSPQEQKREKSLEYKEQGNKFFQQKKFGPAKDAYSKAIENDPSDSIFYVFFV